MYSKYLELTKKLISFKSVSTDPQYKEEVQKTAEWLSWLFKQNGFESQIFEGNGNPVVYASYQVDPAFETVMIYGHYDVQPAEKEDGWKSEPFEVTERDGRLYARGIVDNKGQFLVHVAAILVLLEQGKLQYNIKFLLEGDEETGGAGLGKLIEDQKELFATDHVMISDGEIPYKPMVTGSFRGFMGTTMEVTTANNNLHSGLYGGAVPNAAEEASKLVASLHDEVYLSNIPGFYDDQIESTVEENEKGLMMDSIKEDFHKELGVKKFFKGHQNSITTRIGFETMITVTGFKSGYIGEGYSNIVPNYAEVKFNGRIGPGHDSKVILENMKKFLENNAPEYVDIKFTNPGHYADPIKIDLNTPKMKEVLSLLKEVYDDDVLVDFCGAIVPVVGDFQKILNVEPLVVSLGNEDCNMHGVDENYDIGLIKKGIEFSRRFFSKE